VVLNKADLVDPQAIERVKQFTRDVIKTELGAEPERIFHVSARDVLKGKLDKELNALVEILVELSNQSRSDLAGNSARHAVIYLSHLLIQKIELEKLALLAPLSELDARIESFQRSMKDISDLMLAILTRTKQELKYDWETWESNRQNAVVKGKSLILTSITKELRQSRNRRTQFRKIAKELARTQIRTFLEGWLLNTVEWVNANYSSHAGYVKRETDRLIERVANAASEAFGISIQPYYVVNLDFDPDKLAFDLNIPVLALDISDSLAFCLDLFLPKNIVIAQTIRQTEMLLDEWLLRNMYKIDESVIHWISNSTKLLHDSMQERMKAMQDEILSVLAEGRKRREAGGSAIKNRLMFLESLKARLDALCNEIRID
jgi:Asp-tRNA(Asn)/Glu-tRNA(Gln) amidotransferase C subunit